MKHVEIHRNPQHTHLLSYFSSLFHQAKSSHRFPSSHLACSKCSWHRSPCCRRARGPGSCHRRPGRVRPGGKPHGKPGFETFENPVSFMKKPFSSNKLLLNLVESSKTFVVRIQRIHLAAGRTFFSQKTIQQLRLIHVDHSQWGRILDAKILLKRRKLSWKTTLEPKTPAPASNVTWFASDQFNKSP